LDKPVTGSTGCSCYVRIPRRFAHQRHQDCGRANVGLFRNLDDAVIRPPSL
jgi:hypothetical protein